MPPRTLRIAILDADTPVPNVYSQRGLYSDIFTALLRDAALKSPELSNLKFEFTKYDSVLGHAPSLEELKNIDAILITGSAAAAYDDVAWISSLTDFCKDLYTSHPKVKIFGSCFGHQVICHALFSPPGQNVVCRDPKGYELGVRPIALTPAFISNFGPVTSNPLHPKQLRLQCVHADHVVMPVLPEGFCSIGSSDHCALQGIWKKGRVFTYQGHAEFDRFVNRETVKVFGKLIWDDGYMERALKAVDADDDAVWAAQVMLRFFLEEEVEESVDVGRGRGRGRGSMSMSMRVDDKVMAKL